MSKTNTTPSVEFIDEAKRKRACLISTIDFANPNNTKHTCFWCRHTFDAVPIGCPIRAYTPMVTRVSRSYVSERSFAVTESITPDQVARDAPPGDINTDIAIENRPRYETDGVFCSFSCAGAYITSNVTRAMFANSRTLLVQMFNDTQPNHPVDSITDAPDWRTLRAYGGWLTIDEFRASSASRVFEKHGIVRQFSDVQSIGHMFESKLHIRK